MKDFINMSSLWGESMTKYGEDLTHPFTREMNAYNQIQMTMKEVATKLKVSLITARKRVALGIESGIIKKRSDVYMVNPGYATYTNPCTQEHDYLIELWEAI